MKFFLIGLPGSGKSTLGKQISKLLSIPFVDLDDAIEKAEKRKISEIFRESGEDYFRKIESELLIRWIQSDTDYVMATGGGTPCFYTNIQRMNMVGTTIFLDVPPMEIAHRIHSSKNQDRPLFDKMNFDVLKDQIETLRTRRISFYQMAKETISDKNISSTQLLALIKKESQQ